VGVPVASAISRERLLTVARVLPAAPQAMAGLCELMQDINADSGQIAAQIALDSALAARVVRISNSVHFGGAGAVGSIDEAVNRVGFSEILRLVGAATVANLVDRHLPSYGIKADRLRESLLLHALACEMLARYTEVDPRSAYTAGLLRAIGMMVISRVETGVGHVSPPYDRTRHPSYAEWESERFGVLSTEVTAMIFLEWRFPRATVQAIRGHLFRGPPPADDPFAVILNLAGAIVASAGLALEGEAACWTPTPEKLAAIGLDEDRFHVAEIDARAAFESLAVALQ
jgi:HD-like signal output (HDOD) protein